MTYFTKHLLCFFLLVKFASTQAQISSTLNCFPTRLQFFARESNDSAQLCIAGSIDSSGFDSIQIQILQNAKNYSKISSALSYNSGSAAFSFSPTIYAGLYEYHVRLYIYKNGNATLLKKADSLVCGDVYMINGQSNSHPSNGNATYRNEFCRSFGIQTDNYNYNGYNAKDTFWGLANGDGLGIYSYSGPYMVGVWGIKLMQILKEKYKMPICILNGGSGGSSIEYNLEPANKMDLNSTYGRLLYRFTKAGLADKVKAIFWHQGESNTYANYNDYIGNFDSLYHSWKRDYPSAKNIYVFQIHHGCGGSYQQEIREIQRKFPQKYPDVKIMSTVGIHEHDGCHYYLDGYYEMGTMISKLVARDFYGYTDTTDITPPNILKAYYMPSHMAINLIFDNSASLVWPKDTLGETMKDYIYTDDSIADIKSYTMSGNSLLLKLNKASYARAITYLPNIYNNSLTSTYEGPYLRNKKGVGVLSFYHFPIDSIPPPQANFGWNTQTICSGDSISLKDQSAYKPTSWVWRISGVSPAIYTQQDIKIKFDSSGTYSITLITSNAVGTDSITKNVSITVNANPMVSAGSDTSFCFGDSIQLQASAANTYLWIPATGLSSDSIQNPTVKTTKSTQYILYIADKNGCTNSDTVTISVNPLPAVNAGADIKTCDNSNMIYLSGSPKGGNWIGNGLSGSTFMPTQAGNYTLVYSYTGQCSQTDTMQIEVLSGPKVSIDSIAPVCEGNPLVLSSHVLYTNSVIWNTQGSGTFGSPYDTMTQYQPSPADISNGFVMLSIAAKGNQICPMASDSRIAKIVPLPTKPIIYVQHDTLFTNAAYSWQWMLDTSAIAGSTYQYYKPLVNGVYYVKVYNKFGCEQISDAFTYINTGVLSVSENGLSVYPNPANAEVIIEHNKFDANSVIQLYDISGRLVCQQKLPGERSMMNVINFAKGLYTIRVISNNQLYQKKLLVDR